MKISVVVFAILGLAAVNALPQQGFQGRQEEEQVAAAEAVEVAVEPAVAPEDEKKHATAPHTSEVAPHPLDWHMLFAAAKAVAPVVGGLIEPLLVNIVHGIVTGIVQTINTGFIVAPPTAYGHSYHPSSAHHYETSHSDHTE